MGWLKRTYPCDEACHVSHETIYRSLFIQARGALKRELLQHLRRTRGMRRSRQYSQKTDTHGRIVDPSRSASDRPLEPGAFRALVPAFFALRIALLLLLALLWLLGRKRALFRAIITVNTYFTLALLLDVISLLRVLGGLQHAAASLLIDAALMSLSNMFIFSIWYWIVDPPGVEEDPLEDEPWAFLFPQRGSSLPHYDSWSPWYADYLCIGFTTNFAFSPTDARRSQRVPCQFEVPGRFRRATAERLPAYRGGGCCRRCQPITGQSLLAWSMSPP